MMMFVEDILHMISPVGRFYLQDTHGPSLHRDVQHWRKSCKAFQLARDKRLNHEPMTPFFSYDPFDKWRIDAIGPLLRTSTGTIYILVAVDYMTRWVEAVSIRRIIAIEVGRFIFNSICCRFGTPLEIVSDLAQDLG